MPSEVDSSIIGGLPTTVEDEGVSSQDFNTVVIWSNPHIFKDISCKIGTNIMKCYETLNNQKVKNN